MYSVVPPFKTDKPVAKKLFKRSYVAKPKTTRAKSVPTRASREFDKLQPRPPKLVEKNVTEEDFYSPYNPKVTTYLKDYRDPRTRRFVSREPQNQSLITPPITNRNMKLEPLTERKSSTNFIEGLNEQNQVVILFNHSK